MGFPPAARSGDIVLRAEQLGQGLRPAAVCRRRLADHPRPALGPAGAQRLGKTTLLRCLLGARSARRRPRAGSGQGVEVGYFDQQLAALDDAARRPWTPSARRTSSSTSSSAATCWPASASTGDTALQPVGSLSGGERCRAALARLAAADANFLVLDEPTNHLDLWARDALERALRAVRRHRALRQPRPLFRQSAWPITC